MILTLHRKAVVVGEFADRKLRSDVIVSLLARRHGDSHGYDTPGATPPAGPAVDRRAGAVAPLPNVTKRTDQVFAM
jgi:hypothetical protein